MKHNLKNTQFNVELIKEPVTTSVVVSAKVNSLGREDKDDAFFVADLGDIVHKYKVWKRELPRVEPFYAVKCNDNPAVLSVLAQLGTGFDCASKAEISKMIEQNVAPSRIIYANPCKQNSHIRYAAKHGVAMMTFDNEIELHKAKSHHPDAKLVLRILPPDDSKAQCQLGMKYGAHPKDAPKLLKTAKDLGLNVIGVSFHVGSGCYDPTAFSAAVASARTVFDMGEKAGFQFELLDIGGGFPGQKTAKVPFETMCVPLRVALDVYFPESSGVRIIAEPGRYFVASAFTLATNIIAKRVINRDDQSSDEYEDNGCAEPKFMYYLNDGVYGSFNCLLFDHAKVEPELLESEEYSDKPQFSCSIWGPTCDAIDCIGQDLLLPELNSGDWVIFRDMGAYTMCAASEFNGMPKPRCYYIMHESAWIQMTSGSYQEEGVPQVSETRVRASTLPGVLKSGQSPADLSGSSSVADCSVAVEVMEM